MFGARARRGEGRWLISRLHQLDATDLAPVPLGRYARGDVNNPERVQVLEALLTRIQRNAAQPRATRAASAEVADSRAHARTSPIKETVKEDAIPAARFDPRAEPVSDPAFVAVKPTPARSEAPKPDPLAATAEAPAAKPIAQQPRAAVAVQAAPKPVVTDAPKAARPIGTGFGVRSAFPPKTSSASPAASVVTATPKPAAVAAKAASPAPPPVVAAEPPVFDVSPLPPVPAEPAAPREAAPPTKIKDDAPDGIEAVLARAVVSVDGILEPATYDAPNADPAYAPVLDLPSETAPRGPLPLEAAPTAPIEHLAPLAPEPAALISSTAAVEPVLEQPASALTADAGLSTPVVASPPPPAVEPAGDVAEPPSKFAAEDAIVPEKKKGSLMPLLLVALLFVIGGAVAFYFLRMRTKATVEPPTQPTATATANPTAKPTATATATAAPTQEPTAAPTVTAEPSVAPGLDPKALPKNMAYLSVKAPEGKAMDVLISGKKVGDTSAPIETTCIGAKFVSLAESGTPKPMGRAKSVTLVCQSMNDLEFSEADLRAVAPPPVLPPGVPPTATAPTTPTPPTEPYDPATP